ncbi:hypothetical protein WJX84_000298 [Apatococcus fuscideae]|uniref:Uncharacterized protein n=1 Tax=Apatococcus fuscideae TaxID=2026836 RepID=A0AAW1SXB5_9CHLO
MDTPEERAYKQVFNQTFVSGLGPTSSHEDLIFLVPRDAGHGTQAFVRRRSQEALSDIHHVRIDWHKTLELNLLVHSEYTLTVAACSYDALHIHRLQDACPNGAGLTQVRRNISALPVHMTVCPDGGKGGWEQPQPSYPNIYFAVDDFQDVFSSLVLPDAHWTDAGGWKSKLWSFAASKLPPSLTGAEAVSQDVGPMQVRCALMSLCLPVDLLHQKMTA